MTRAARHSSNMELPPDARGTLTEIVEGSRGRYPAEVNYPFDEGERAQATNVQTVLKNMGYDVTLSDAAAVWECYSGAYQAGWLDGADTVKEVYEHLVCFAVARQSGSI